MTNSRIGGIIKNSNLTEDAVKKKLEEEKKLNEVKISEKRFVVIMRSFEDIFRLLDKFINTKKEKSLTFKEKKIASDNINFLEKFRYDTPQFYQKLEVETLRNIDDKIDRANRILFNRYRSRSGVKFPIKGQLADTVKKITQ